MIPITVFTGFLGAGKTSIILSLLPQLPNDYKVVLLKNEFGDVKVDSQLARQSSLTAVDEILNGCMCCVLVGQMKTALLAIRETYRPDRIIIECSLRPFLPCSLFRGAISDVTTYSGSAFPATIAFQIRELERETANDLKLDAIVTVIDAENFTGYEDTSPTAKMQASYTDIILINKWEHVSDRHLDLVIDHLNTLNDSTPKIRCNGRGGIDPTFIFGVESKLFLDGQLSTYNSTPTHNDEVETFTVYRGPRWTKSQKHLPKVDCSCGAIDPMVPNGEIPPGKHREAIDKDALSSILSSLTKESTWRVKGFVRLVSGVHILNWAFGRFELRKVQDDEHLGELVRLTVMGERGEVKRSAYKLAEALEAEVM